MVCVVADADAPSSVSVDVEAIAKVSQHITSKGDEIRAMKPGRTLGHLMCFSILS